MINRKIVMIPGPSPTVRSIQDQMGETHALSAILNSSGTTRKL